MQPYFRDRLMSGGPDHGAARGPSWLPTNRPLLRFRRSADPYLGEAIDNAYASRHHSFGDIHTRRSDISSSYWQTYWARFISRN